MAIDWSVQQTPAYSASKMYHDAASDAGQWGVTGAALLGKAALTRPDLEAKNMAEGIRGQGRSYYKDNVDKSLYGTYDEWLQSENAGRYLKLAEGGANFTMQDGQYMVQTPDGSWANMGAAGQDLSEGQFYDPYKGEENLNPYEMHMRETMMGQDWAGGQYTYKAPKTALGALFSKERYRPRANLYRQSAFEGMTEESQEKWKGLADRTLKGQGTGYYPGVGVTALGAVLGFGEKDKNAPGQTPNTKQNQTSALTALMQGLGLQSGPVTPTQSLQGAATPTTSPSGSSTQPTGTKTTTTSSPSLKVNTGFMNQPHYGIIFVQGNVLSNEEKQQANKLFEERGITEAAWKKHFDDYRKANPYSHDYRPENVFLKIRDEGYTINANGELVKFK